MRLSPTFFSLISVSGSLFLAGPGCARRESPAEAGVHTQTLLLGNLAEPADVDPQVVLAYTDMNISYALFEGLTWVDAKTERPVPGVAERWDISPDGKVYTFHLRPNARWSNGDPLTAGDFVAAFRRELLPAFAATYCYMLWPIRNAEAFNAGKITDFKQVGVEALDEHTLRISLELPTPYLLALASHPTWMPVPCKVISQFGPVEQKGSAWSRPGNLVGNGPFRLTEWTPNSRLVVVKNPYYWGAGNVRLDSIVFYPMDDAGGEERAFRAGQLDVTSKLPVSKIAAYRAELPSRLRIEPVLNTTFLNFNTTRPPFDRPDLRRALSLAIDREAISRDIYLGSLPPAHSLTAPDCGGYTAQAAVPDDVVEARALLARAGFPEGRGLPPIDVITHNDSDSQRMMVAIQTRWATELGVHVTLTPLEQKTLFQDQQSLDYSIGQFGWYADYADPYTYLGMFTTGNGNNVTGWSNREYDRLVDATTRTADNGRRFALFQQAEAVLLQSSPVAPITFGGLVHVIQPTVHGWQVNQLGFQHYQDIWLGDH